MKPQLQHTRSTILAFAFTLLTLTALPQLNASPSIADYGALANTSMMRISPAGNVIAFRKTDNTQDTLIAYSLTDKKVLRAVDLSLIQPQNIYFTNNNTLILSVSEYRRLSGYKGTHDISSAFSLNIKSGKLEQLLVPGRKIYAGQTGLGVISGITPDGKHVLMPTYLEKKNYGLTYGLVQVDIQKPKRLKVIERGTDDSRQYFVAPSGKLLAQERYDANKRKHTVLTREGKKWKIIFEQETDLIDYGFAGIAPDLQSLVVIEENEDTGQDEYLLMSLKTGEFTNSPYSRTDKSIEAVLSDLNNVIQGVQYSGFSPSYKLFSPTADTLINKIMTKFPEQSVWISDHTPDWTKIIVLVEGSGYAGEYYLFDQSLNAQFLAQQRTNIKPEDIHPIATYTYKAQDGLKIPTLLTIPKASVKNIKNLPTIILPHGGPESYDRLGFNWLAQAFANQGYLVVQPQFRGSEGFGLEHTLAGRGEWGKKMQSDISDGVHHLIDKGMIDPSRICIAGWSYGGYAALAGGAFTPELYQCIVSIAGVSDLPRMLAQERRDHGRNSEIVRYWNLSIAKGKVDKKALKNVSPVFHANQFQAPVLLAHGEHDQVVKIKQSKVMHNALLKAGKKSKLLTLGDDNHSLLESKTRTQMLEAVINFVNTHPKQSATTTEPAT